MLPYLHGEMCMCMSMHMLPCEPSSVRLVYAMSLQGVWTRVRLSVADHTGVSAAVTLACLNSSGTECCEARQVARDSMYLSTLPGPSATSWTLSSVGRLDLAVKCSAPGALAWNGGAIALAIVSSLDPAHLCVSTHTPPRAYWPHFFLFLGLGYPFICGCAVYGLQ